MKNLTRATQSGSKAGIIILVVILALVASREYGPEWMPPLFTLLLVVVTIYFRSLFFENGVNTIPFPLKKVLFWSIITVLLLLAILQLAIVKYQLF